MVGWATCWQCTLGHGLDGVCGFVRSCARQVSLDLFILQMRLPFNVLRLTGVRPAAVHPTGAGARTLQTAAAPPAAARAADGMAI